MDIIWITILTINLLFTLNQFKKWLLDKSKQQTYLVIYSVILDILLILAVLYM